MIKLTHKSQIPNPNGSTALTIGTERSRSAKSQINPKSQIPKCQTKKFWSLAIWSLVIICNLVLGAWNLPSLFAQDKIVAIVNNDVITQKDLNDFINFMRIQLSGEFQGAELENKIQSMKLDLLDKLIEDRIILQEAKRNNLKTDEDRIKAKINEIKKNYDSDTDFENAIAKQGLAQADIESRIREQILMYHIIDMKVRSKIIVNPTEITDFYQKNTEEFRQPQQREFESIAIGDEKLAREILNYLKAGQQLEELAEKYSLTVNKFSAAEDGQLRKDIEGVVFGMKPTEISGPIKIQDNYYIFKLIRIIPPRQQKLSEVQDKIYAFLFDKKMQEELTKWLDGLKKQSYIKIIQD